MIEGSITGPANRLQSSKVCRAVLAGVFLLLVAGCSGDDVLEPQPSGTTVTVSPSAVLLQVGQTRQLEAEVREDGRVVAEPTVTWSSSNPAVATVSETGLVTATGIGTATIIASVEQAEGTGGSAAVTVEACPLC